VTAYYNEHEPYAAQWLRNLIDAGLIPAGDVDERSIVDVSGDDLAGYAQCHFFAGIGGWSLAARLAGWPDDRELWTGSAPCQPFSVAGKGKAQSDDRHLWPHLFRLVRARRPAVLMGEQVAAAVGKDWLDGIAADLEGIGYACGAAVVPACAVDAPHRRDRLWFVADAGRPGLEGRRGPVSDFQREDRQAVARGVPPCSSGVMDNATRNGWREGGGIADEMYPAAIHAGSGQSTGAGSAWGRHDFAIGHDGKARRVEPDIRLLAHGVPARVGRLRAFGNAIVPQVAAEVIGAYMDCAPTNGKP
jgi:DNA (cytosine-5)-methyltransferase 1